MNRPVLAAAALALIGIFVAIAVSVVDARRPLDGSVAKSFQVTLSRLAGGTAVVDCHKTRVDFYDCTSVVTPRSRRTSVTLRHKLWVTDDGCWRAFRRLPVPPPTALGPLAPRSVLIRGCVAGAHR